MFGSPETGFIPPSEIGVEKARGTSKRLRFGCEKIVGALCRTFTIDGEANLEEIRKAKQENPDARFVLTSSHLSNLDLPAAVKVFGKDLDIQIVVESRHRDLLPQQILYNLAGRQNFTYVDYKKTKRGYMGVFNPDNFEELAELTRQGITPWIASHKWTTGGEMIPLQMGPIYLAHKTGAKIIPSALELHGGSISLEGPKELVKGLLKRADAIYHIGKPMDLPPVDISAIDTVINKRKNKEKVTPEEIANFRAAHKALQEQAELLASVISGMLPPEQRGVYNKEKAAEPEGGTETDK